MVIEVIQANNGRWYRQNNGLYYPSITTVIGWHKKDSLESWQNRVGHDEAERIKKKAADRGTIIHEMAENYILGSGVLSGSAKDHYDGDRALRMAFKKIKVGIDRTIPLGSDRIISERGMVSHTLKVAGRCDLISPVIDRPNGQRSILDFKTAEKERRDEWNEGYFIQLTGYSVMHEEMTGEQIDDIRLIFSIDALSIPVIKSESAGKWKADLIRMVEEFHSNIKGPKF